MNGPCGGLEDVVGIIKHVVDIIKILIPIGLIVYGLLDLGKAVIAGKEDEMKKAQGTLVKRCIYAAAVFLVVNLVVFITGIVGAESWQQCWTNVGGNTDIGDSSVGAEG
ncbi:MAG: hypothetical protein SO108_03140 [Bacilli bacterium]|nr:hypothetical protein [Bacilli bacterium]